MSSSSDTNRGLKKGKWSKEEDEMLKAYVENHGTRNWNEVSRNAGLIRCGKSCRLRWYNHLRPDVKKGPFSEEEKRKVFQFFNKFGEFKWSKLAQELPGRSDNDIKNFWNARKRKLEKRGLSPFPDKMELNYELNKNGSNSQQVKDSQDDEFKIPQVKFGKYSSIYDEISENNFEKLLDVPNMLYNNVGSTSTSNHTTSTLIYRGSIGTSRIPMAMVSDLPPPPQCSYLPLPSRKRLGEYPQIPPPMESQYQMSESSSPYKSGSLKSMLYRQENWEGFGASRVHSAELNLVDEKGKKSISLENDVVVSHGDFMDLDLRLDNNDARHVHSSETNLVDEKGKKPISLEDDLEANLDDFMDLYLSIDFS